ncbi:MAG: glucose dehydrogenase, partial [Planctomycetales bacterium]|nr:glucose dehydrogenase [Planctomycetales bacterium]
RHGFMTEAFVDDENYIVRVPPGLAHLHVLMEPMSCAAKAVQQAFEVQRRMKVWRPRVAYVMGAGQIGLLATLILRLRGLQVYTIARRRPPRLPADIVAGMEATYVSTEDTPMDELLRRTGKPDIIMEATGSSNVVFESMQILNHNGVLILHSVTGGEAHVKVPADKINLEWVLGNKLLVGSVNANREHFESGIRDLALGEVMYPGVVERILTTPVDGLDNYQRLMRLLVEEKDALKVYMNVSDE